MADYRVRADSPEHMADALIATGDHARDTADQFTFGPFNKGLLENGLFLLGDTENVIAVLRDMPGLTIERLDDA